jgi:hypothetical protein
MLPTKTVVVGGFSMVGGLMPGLIICGGMCMGGRWCIIAIGGGIMPVYKVEAHFDGFFKLKKCFEKSLFDLP